MRLSFGNASPSVRSLGKEPVREMFAQRSAERPLWQRLPGPTSLPYPFPHPCAHALTEVPLKRLHQGDLTVLCLLSSHQKVRLGWEVASEGPGSSLGHPSSEHNQRPHFHNAHPKQQTRKSVHQGDAALGISPPRQKVGIGIPRRPTSNLETL